MPKLKNPINKELLINLVHKRPAIWDKNSEVYKDKQLKSAAWREICAILRDDFKKMDEISSFAYVYQKHWKCIRDNYRRAVSLKENRSASGKVLRRRPIKYEKLLGFLKPFLEQRKKVCNLDSSSDDAESEASDNSHTKSTSDDPLYTPGRKERKSHKMPSDMLEINLDEGKSAEPHPTDSFFTTMAATVKKLPPNIQAQIKRDVFKVVNDAEFSFYSADAPANTTQPTNQVTQKAPINAVSTTSIDINDDTNEPDIPIRKSKPQFTYSKSAIASKKTFQFKRHPQVIFVTPKSETINEHISATHIPITSTTMKLQDTTVANTNDINESNPIDLEDTNTSDHTEEND